MLAETEAPPSKATTHCAAAAVENATRALRATNPLAGWSLGQRAQTVHDGGMARLSTAALCARSPSLSAALREAMDAKAENHRLSVETSKAEWILKGLEQTGAVGPEVEAADAIVSETDAAWHADLKDVLEVAANKVAIAPVADLDDVLIRAAAYPHIIGTTDPANATGLPDCEEDLVAMYHALRDGIIEISQRDKVGPDDLEVVSPSRYRETIDRLHELCQQDEAVSAGKVVMDPPAQEELQEALTDFYARKDRQADLILAWPATDLSELLLQFEVICDLAFDVDVSTYAVRDGVIGADPVIGGPVLTTAQLNLDGSKRRSLAFFAANLADMRDRQMPTDWRKLWDSVQHLHPNSRDAARRAYDAHLPAAGLRNIQLDGRSNNHLPVFTFEDKYHRPGFVTVGPNAAHDWSPV